VPPTIRPWRLPQRPDSAFNAALFDLDGVITPTADVHMSAWRRTFTEYFEQHDVTPPYSDSDYFDYVDGKPRYDGVRACLESRGITLPDGSPDDPAGKETVCGVGNSKNDAFIAILREDGVEPYPGSVSLMDHLDRIGVPMAIVSSSRNAPEVLKAAGVARRFDVVVDGSVTAERGLAGKPAPDTYAYAAQLLGVDGKKAVVVEDATSGVAAGAAGDFGLVVGVDRGAGEKELMEAGADVVVKDLAELVER